MAERKVCSNKGCEKKFMAKDNRKKYCSTQCSQKSRHKKYKQKKADQYTSQMTVSRGEHYQEYVKEFAEAVDKKLIQKQEVAKLLKISNPMVTKMHEAYLIDKSNLKAAENWETPEEAIKSLQKFEDFRDRYFQTETGEIYETADFHQRWIQSILDAIDEGGEQMILSPPRHGKTDLLTHFAIWQICRSPNVRIMWVGGNEEIAKNAVGAVVDHLEHNEKLIEDFCGPGQTFKPKSRSGKSWTSGQFTIATRTVTGIKSPTMVAVGKGGKILSRDCDLIIADDIEDHGTTVQPSAREQTRQWWTTTLSSRKEEHTAIVVIGSRQHPEDLYNFLLENPEMNTIVEEAHSTECVLPENEIEIHTDCMLWSGKRSYKWLLSRLRSAETTGGKAIFEMVYLNKAFVEGITMFDVEEVDKCRDINRVIGHIPAGTQLIAGLDPASTGYQACFLWAVNSETGKMYMVDIENQEGGGVIQAKETIKKWHEMYNLSHWVIEENGFQRAIRQDRDLKDYTTRVGIYLEGHQTQKNKFDPIFGVGSMRELFKEELISLPYGSAESETKSNIYRRQLIYFSTGASKQSGRNNKSDVVMASWFPLRVIRRLQKERLAEVGLDYEPSFGEWDISNMNESPWG
jgi:hypothetical protein|tara:strand:- start:1841 stop:3727 length:1887 start_codon:yes stop_codon:yes gene_type:complete